ncbi:MAG TPA: ROK family protein [Pirellulales bacterium]
MSLYGAVDLGGTTVKAAIADRAGRVLTQGAIPTDSHQGPEAVVERIADFVLRLAREANDSQGTDATLAGLGIGAPGLVDVTTGATLFLPNLPTQWRGVSVGTRLTERLGCRVRLLNDVRMATLGELRFGHGRELPNVTMAFFSIGTGIGGGVAVEGRLRLGPLGAAGELGHQTILPNGPRCGCGNQGCLEALASGPAIAGEGVRLLRSGLAPRLHELVQGDAGRVTPREMLTAAEAGDELVRDVIDRAAEYLGIAAANTATTLHPDLIVLGGGVAELGDVLLRRVRAVVAQRVKMFPAESVRIERSQLGERAGIMGAVALAHEAAGA